jgi:hypothetical protein
MYLCLQGLTAGSKHDSFMLTESNLLPQLQQMFPNNEFALYGDPAYPNSGVLWTGFRNPPSRSPEAHFNNVCRRFRYVLNGVSKELQQFVAQMGNKASPIAKHYITAVFIQNMRTCFYGNLTSRVFGCRAMDIDEYIKMVWKK